MGVSTKVFEFISALKRVTTKELLKPEANPFQEGDFIRRAFLEAETAVHCRSTLLCTHYPNRIFIGSLSGKTTAAELASFFRNFGTVLEGKIILDDYGRSRRFGFVTFASHKDVNRVLSQGPIFLHGKRINVGPAVKKLIGTRPQGSSPPLPIELSPPPTPSKPPAVSSLSYSSTSSSQLSVVYAPFYAVPVRYVQHYQAVPVESYVSQIQMDYSSYQSYSQCYQCCC